MMMYIIIGIACLVGIIVVVLLLPNSGKQQQKGQKYRFELSAGGGRKITFADPFDNFLVYGGANSGKTKSIGKPLLSQYIQAGFAGFVYNYKDFDLARTAVHLVKSKYSINSLVYWVTYVHNVVYSFYRSMIYCYINSTQRCAGSIVIDIIPTNGADKRKFFPFAPYFPVTNVIKRYFYPYFPAIIGIKGYSFPYFPYLSGIMKIKTALYSLFSRLDWHKTVVFPCLGEIYEGIRSLSWEIPVT